MADAHKNFAYSTVATAPSPATSGTSLVVAAGEGALFPTPPFNATIWPIGANPLSTNAEIVRVTGIATDTLTITRTQESTSARTVIVGDQIAATITAKTLTDVENSPVNARVYNNANIAIANTTLVTLTFNSERWDNGGIHGAATSKLIAPVSGLYAISANVAFAFNNTGQRIIVMQLNGSTAIAEIVQQAPSANPHFISLTTQYQLSINDYVEVQVYQTSGTSLNIEVYNNCSPEFMMAKIY